MWAEICYCQVIEAEEKKAENIKGFSASIFFVFLQTFMDIFANGKNFSPLLRNTEKHQQEFIHEVKCLHLKTLIVLYFTQLLCFSVYHMFTVHLSAWGIFPLSCAFKVLLSVQKSANCVAPYEATLTFHYYNCFNTAHSFSLPCILGKIEQTLCDALHCRAMLLQKSLAI